MSVLCAERRTAMGLLGAERRTAMSLMDDEPVEEPVVQNEGPR